MVRLSNFGLELVFIFIVVVKAHLRRYYHRFVDSLFPEQDLIDACFMAVTPEKARGWFRDCGYLPA